MNEYWKGFFSGLLSAAILIGGSYWFVNSFAFTPNKLMVFFASLLFTPIAHFSLAAALKKNERVGYSEGLYRFAIVESVLIAFVVTVAFLLGGF